MTVPAALFPTTYARAAALRSQHPDAVVVAGGTDVMVAVNDGRRDVDTWISTRRIVDRDRVEIDSSGPRPRIRLGAGVTMRQIERTLATNLPALAEAARTVGGPQIRAAGTIGGNLATASPAGDTLPVLACYDAQIELVGPDHRRRVPLEGFVTGPKSTVLAADEMIGAVHLEAIEGAQAFAKVGTRNAMVISICSAAVRFDIRHREARIAMGSVGPTIVRASLAESLLLAGAPCREVAAAAAEATDPIDDHRSTARYRRYAIAVLVERLLARTGIPTDGIDHG